MDTQEKPIVHGDPENGFIVEHHDGDRHLTHGCMAENEDAAISDACRKWDEDAAGAEQADDDEHADAKRVNRADVEAMLAERDAKIADLESRLSAHDRKFDAIHEALAEISKPADALGVSDPGHTGSWETAGQGEGGYPGARRPPPEAKDASGESSKADAERDTKGGSTT